MTTLLKLGELRHGYNNKRGLGTIMAVACPDFFDWGGPSGALTYARGAGSRCAHTQIVSDREQNSTQAIFIWTSPIFPQHTHRSIRLFSNI